MHKISKFEYKYKNSKSPIKRQFIQQGDQLKRAVFSGTLYKVTCSVFANLYVYTGQVTFYKVPEKHIYV